MGSHQYTAHETHLVPCYGVRHKRREADHVIQHQHNDDFIQELEVSSFRSMQGLNSSDQVDSHNDGHCFDEDLGD